MGAPNPPEKRAAILAAYEAGTLLVKDIAATYGVTKKTVYEMARAAGAKRAVDHRGDYARRNQRPAPVGEQFGRLRVTGPEERNAHGQRAAWCDCQCGTRKLISLSALWLGTIRSCGCLKQDVVTGPENLARLAAITTAMRKPERRIRKGRGTHGLGKHPLYGRWHTMKTRCEVPTHPSYVNYGARGIAIHESLRTIQGYIAYVEGTLLVPAGMVRNEDAVPAGRLTEEQRTALYATFTIDREDNDADYAPGNLRWADHRTQANNRRPARPRRRKAS